LGPAAASHVSPVGLGEGSQARHRKPTAGRRPGRAFLRVLRSRVTCASRLTH